MRIGVGVLLVVAMSVGVAACGGPVDTSSKDRLTTVNLNPPEGSRLSEDSNIEADLAYSISDFEPEKYFVISQVKTIGDDGKTYDGDYPDSLYPKLTQAEGTVHFSFPVRYVWKGASTQHPLVVWFHVVKSVGPTTSKVVAVAGPFHYSE